MHIIDRDLALLRKLWCISDL